MTLTHTKDPFFPLISVSPFSSSPILSFPFLKKISSMIQKFISSPSSDAMDSYVKALEEERKKILVFERELPFSLQLVTQAIESCCQRRHHQHIIVGSDQEISTSGEGGVYPVLEEFIPLRPARSNSNLSSEEEEEEEEDTRHDKISYCNGDSKPDWLRSVQLWNQEEPDPPIPTPTPTPTEELEEHRVVLHKPIPVIATRVGAFHPFEKEKNLKGATAPVSLENNNNGKEEREKEEEGKSTSQRKARRCWSPELHRRFLHALNQLGGSHAATPKQIRELMKVDGLTNDEVKSHLQKYRLHTRRRSTGAVQSSSSSSTQPHQIVLVGGLWLPPQQQYNAAQPTADAAAGGAPFNGNGIYAPVASLPSELGSEQHQKMKQQSKRSPTGPLKSVGRSIGDNNNDGERTNSDSSATASSLSSH